VFAVLPSGRTIGLPGADCCLHVIRENGKIQECRGGSVDDTPRARDPPSRGPCAMARCRKVVSFMVPYINETRMRYQRYNRSTHTETSGVEDLHFVGSEKLQQLSGFMARCTNDQERTSYSDCRLAALVTSAYFATSAFICAASSSGVDGVATKPSRLYAA
jgi:hypothetical protein